jgi:replicative superfamily II helicase
MQESKKNFYKKFLYEPFPVESCLGPRLCSTLNAEIAAKTISSIDDCIGYMDWTFFSRRLQKNPSFYGAKSGNQDDIDDFMYETIKKCTDDLQDYECISLSEENDVTSTYLGLSASKFYLNFKTPKKMLLGSQATRNLLQKRSDDNMKKKEITPSSSNAFMFSRTLEEIGVSSIVFTIAHTPEFDEVPVRHSEDQIVADLSEQLSWGALSPIAPSIIGEQSNKKEYHQSEELMADPHTK